MLREVDVYIKNIGDSAIILPEIGGYSLEPDEEINMMDPELPYGCYEDYQAVVRALNNLENTVLYQQRVAGNLEYRFVAKDAL